MLDEETIAFFWENVKKGAPDECWGWLLSKHDYAYGVVRLPSGKTIQSTHIALILDGRPRPDGAMALHSCDWPPCQNPAHLRWGTAKENSQDWITRGRFRPRPEKPKRADPPPFEPFGWADMRTMTPEQKIAQLALRRDAVERARQRGGTKKAQGNALENEASNPQETADKH